MAAVIPDNKSIVRQLLALSSDPENQTYIAQEAGCLCGLINYLSNADHEVVLMAVQALRFLASHPKNVDTLRARADLISHLERIVREGDGKMGEIAHDTLASLGLLSHDKENLASENTSPSEPSPVREPKASQLHTITLRVEGITDGATRAVVERALIGVHGVISVTVDQRRSHAVVCTRTPESVLTSITDALRAHGTDATPVAPRAPLEAAKGANSAPGYLDDEEEPAKPSNSTLSTFGYSSLAARLEARRLEEERARAKEARTQRFISKVSSSLGSWRFW